MVGWGVGGCMGGGGERFEPRGVGGLSWARVEGAGA